MNKRLPQVDGLRGLAVLGVIWHHGYSGAVKQLAASHDYPIYFLGDGWMGVMMFFVMSGFVLALPFVSGETTIDTLKFYRHRALRLLPLFALGCFVGYLVNSTSFTDLLLSITTLHLLTPGFFPAVNGPFWSLSEEIWFSLALPALLFAGFKFGFWRLASLRLSVRFCFG